MQFPQSWLREFCNPTLSTQALADTLTMGGLEVEAMQPVAPPFSGVLVGQVLETAPHPNADKLKVCRVDVGAAEPLTIVCGAPNVQPGIKVPCAQIGAELPPAQPGGDPLRIGLGVLRGVQSQGMLCSARELRLSDEHGGLLILAPDARVGSDVREHLQLDDTLVTLKLTPNLGHCLSVFGVARELAALTGAPLQQPPRSAVTVTHSERLPVDVQAPDLCGRFSGRVIRNVDPNVATPTWMVERLARCGQRSVSPLVDISNYVMFELGQPTHVFDLDRLDGGLTVRWGRAGEQLGLLNGSTVALDDTVGVVADASAVESLAGIMGGQATAVGDGTRNVYVEAAFWWPEAVAGRSRRFNFSTDAGHRFERGVDPALTVAALDRVTALIVDICGGEPGPVDDQVVGVSERAPVSLRVDRAARVIGMPISLTQCIDVFERLGFAHTSDGDALRVTPPSWRFDLTIEEDLIEEVIRLIGFQNLPDTPPRAPVEPLVRAETARGPHALRRAVAALGYQETVNFSFVEARWEHELAGNPDPVRLLNPIAALLSVMRSSLLGGLVQVLRVNLARKAARVRVFELGRVFLRDPAAADGPDAVAGLSQPLRLAGLAHGPADMVQWGQADRPVDIFDVKGDIESLFEPRSPRFVAAEHPALHPGRCARIELDGVSVGWVGELHPRWRQRYDLPSAPVLFELELAAVGQRPLPSYVPLPKQQPVWRDIAVVVGADVTADAVLAAAEAADTGGLLRKASLFDVYRPKPGTAPAELSDDERSLAIRLELLDDAAPLTDERAEAAVAAVRSALASQVRARQRA